MRIRDNGNWKECAYLVNNYLNDANVIANIGNNSADRYNRIVYPEFNEQVFLEACGYQTAEAKLDDVISRRLDELSERIARLEGGQVEDAKPEIDYSRIKTGSRVKLKGRGDRIFGVVFWDSPYYISRSGLFCKGEDRYLYFTFYFNNKYLSVVRRKNEKPDFVTEVIEY